VAPGIAEVTESCSQMAELTHEISFHIPSASLLTLFKGKEISSSLKILFT
jgi:hypothetical protein